MRRKTHQSVLTFFRLTDEPLPLPVPARPIKLPRRAARRVAGGGQGASRLRQSPPCSSINLKRESVGLRGVAPGGGLPSAGG